MHIASMMGYKERTKLNKKKLKIDIDLDTILRMNEDIITLW